MKKPVMHHTAAPAESVAPVLVAPAGAVDTAERAHAAASEAPAAPTRRQFLRLSAVAGGGLIAGWHMPLAPRAAAASGQASAAAARAARPLQANAFVRITPDNWVIVTVGSSEIGQGTSTALPMLVAEELDADWSRVRWEQAPTDPIYANPAMHMQVTGGSMSTPGYFEPMRRAGAAVRAVLVAAAAKRWLVHPSTLTTSAGRVRHAASRRSLTYGELAGDAAGLPVPEKPPLKDPKTFTIIGQPKRRLDAREKVDGSGTFGIDVYVPNMLTAVVARPPLFGGKLRSFDGTKANAVPGVVGIFAVPSGVAVVAKDFWSAKRGRDALTIEWEPALGERVSSDEQAIAYRTLLDIAAPVARNDGDAAAAATSAARTITADYAFPYLAHATMEPMNAVADVRADRCEIWASTQWPSGDQAFAARALGMKPEQVTVHVTLVGGGFGRRSSPQHDFVVEAVHVSKAARAPVKVVWTREDDMRGGWYRPAAACRLTASLDAKGAVTGLTNRIVVQSLTRGTGFDAFVIKDGIDGQSVEGGREMPYAIPNVRVELHSPLYQVPVLWLRSVGHSFNAFAVETFIDQLAHEAKQDPCQFRRGLLAGKARHLGVLDAAAQAAGWDKPLPPERFRGIAVHASYGSFIANVIEVSVDAARTLRIHRVVLAIDAGLLINPDLVKAQMESSIVFGLSAALFGEITLEKGVVQQGNYDDYPVLRMHQTPAIEVVLVSSSEPPSGVGEPGVAAVAPALANAIFAATGARVRSLPLTHHDFRIA